MPVAYVDTSYLLGVAFGESGARNLVQRLEAFDTLVSANLLTAEFLAAHVREKAPPDERLLARLAWVFPDRSIEPEISRVLTHGYVRGADCWHLAVALFVADDASTLSFLTLDEAQRRIAAKLGFAGS